MNLYHPGLLPMGTCRPQSPHPHIQTSGFGSGSIFYLWPGGVAIAVNTGFGTNGSRRFLAMRRVLWQNRNSEKFVLRCRKCSHRIFFP